MEEITQPRKDYNRPMHTVEHLLNGTIASLLGCGRAFSTHIERKKSKCDYRFDRNLTADEIATVEARVNEAITAKVPVTEVFMSRSAAAEAFSLSRLPDDAGDTVRIVQIGHYDSCPCIGEHVANTSEIDGRLKIISSDCTDGVLRVRFRVVQD